MKMYKSERCEYHMACGLKYDCPCSPLSKQYKMERAYIENLKNADLPLKCNLKKGFQNAEQHRGMQKDIQNVQNQLDALVYQLQHQGVIATSDGLDPAYHRNKAHGEFLNKMTFDEPKPEEERR